LLSAFVRALRDPRTFAVSSNGGLWLGFAISLPIPVLAFVAGAPAWIRCVSLAAPFAWSVVVGAAARMAGLRTAELERLDESATSLAHAGEEERASLQVEVAHEKSENERLTTMHARMDAELLVAQRVNRSLLPDDISRPGVEVAVRQIPYAFVGGDYLQATLVHDDVLYLCIGDVSGHGVAAALVVSRIHGLVQRMIAEERAPWQFLADLDETTSAIVRHTTYFLTFAVLRVHLSEGRIEYATAGHPAPFLVRTDGRIEELRSGNGLLGTGPDVRGPAAPRSVPYDPGDTVVLFTDGLFEVAARDGDGFLGESGLRSCVAGLKATSPHLAATEILRRVSEFGRIGAAEDDVSLMVARLDRVAPRTVVPRAPLGAT
jgi:sigma-B regulation protein RsbU (phosphoserine phosphatase)